MLSNDSSFPAYTELSGLPLQNGEVYFGVAGLNPVTNPVTVYWDSAGTQPAVQPVMTVNGMPSRNGTPTRVWIKGDYSRLVLDTKGRQVLYEQSVSPLGNAGGSAGIGYSNAGGVARTVQDRLREVVSVADYYAGDWVAAFNTAFANGKAVEVPAGVNVTGINSAIAVPAGKDLVIYGSITGNGAGSFSFPDTCEVFARGGTIDNVGLVLAGGGPRVRGLRMSGYGPTAMILIQGTGTYANLLIDDFVIQNANFGVLRQGSGSSLRNAQITRGQFYNLRGDAIEFNVCVNDVGVQVIDHLIDTIDNTGGQPNWGIGIGFAGTTYDNTYPDSATVKDFTIARIRGRNLRQLIHVENGKRFEIADIAAQKVDATFSTASGLQDACVVVYGSSDFVIDGVKADDASRILVKAGTVGGAINSAPQNFTIRNCRLANTGIDLDTGNAASTVSVKNIESSGANAYLKVAERPGSLTLDGITLDRPRASGTALSLDLDLNIDGRQAFRPSGLSSLAMRNVIARDEYNCPSAALTGVVQSVVRVVGCNFTVSPSKTVLKPIGRTFRVATAGVFPFGVEFIEGDLVIDTDGPTRWLVTAGGSSNRAGDTFAVVDATTIRSVAGLSWTSVNQHEPGQQITLPGCGPGGADLQTTVVRTFVGSSQFRMQVADAISAVAGTAGTIAATNPVAFSVV